MWPEARREVIGKQNVVPLVIIVKDIEVKNIFLLIIMPVSV